MKNLQQNQNGGLIMTVIVVATLMVLGYVTINNFLTSEEGQEIQKTADTTRQSAEQTLDNAGNTIDSANQIIENVR